jgi:hypothetical protein
MFSQLRNARLGGVNGRNAASSKAAIQEHPELEFVEQCMANIRSHWPSLLSDSVKSWNLH